MLSVFNLFRPQSTQRRIPAKKTRIYGLAMQRTGFTQKSEPPAARGAELQICQ